MSDPKTINFTLSDGSSVAVEAVDGGGDGGLERIGRGGEPASAQRGFAEAVARIRPAAQVLLDGLKELNTPDEINLEFGLKFGFKAGAIIASADSEAVFKVSIKRKNPAA